MYISDPIKRAFRTFLQAFIGTFSTLAIPFLLSVINSAGDSQGFVAINLTILGNALIAGVIAGIIAIVSFVQNWLEDNTDVPKVLK